MVRLRSVRFMVAAMRRWSVLRRDGSQASLRMYQHTMRTPVATLQDASSTHPSAMPTLPLPAIAAGAKAKSAKRPSLARTLSLDRTAGSKPEAGAGLVRTPHLSDHAINGRT